MAAWTCWFQIWMESCCNFFGPKSHKGGPKYFLGDFRWFIGIKITAWTCWFQMWMKSSWMIILGCENYKIVSKNGKIFIIAFFGTFLHFPQPLVNKDQILKLILNQLSVAVMLIPVNPTNSMKFFFQEGSPPLDFFTLKNCGHPWKCAKSKNYKVMIYGLYLTIWEMVHIQFPNFVKFWIPLMNRPWSPFVISKLSYSHVHTCPVPTLNRNSEIYDSSRPLLRILILARCALVAQPGEQGKANGRFAAQRVKEACVR